jgi:hypothetical protein
MNQHYNKTDRMNNQLFPSQKLMVFELKDH